MKAGKALDVKPYVEPQCHGATIMFAVGLALTAPLASQAKLTENGFEPDWIGAPDSVNEYISFDRNVTLCGFVVHEINGQQYYTGQAVLSVSKTGANGQTRWTTTIDDVRLGNKVSFTHSDIVFSADYDLDVPVVDNNSHTITRPNFDWYHLGAYQGIDSWLKEVTNESGGTDIYWTDDAIAEVVIVEPNTPFSELKGLAFEVSGSAPDGSLFTATIKVGANGVVSVLGTLPSGKKGFGSTYVVEYDRGWRDSDGREVPPSAGIPVVLTASDSSDCLTFYIGLTKIDSKWNGSFGGGRGFWGYGNEIYWVKPTGTPVKMDASLRKTADGGKGGGGNPSVSGGWQKARTLTGVVTQALPSPYHVRGVFQLKCGKVNKKGIAKVSATLTGVDGKKTRFKAQSVTVADGAVTIPFRYSENCLLPVSVYGDEFDGHMTDLNGVALDGGLGVRNASVGGIVNADTLKFSVHDFAFTADAGFSALEWLVPGTMLDEDYSCLKEFEAVHVNRTTGKWTCGKPVTAKIIQYRPGKPAPLCCIDEDSSYYYLNVACDCNMESNLSSLKLTYTPKTGLFKGSFMIYATDKDPYAANVKAKLKKYKAVVSGVVVNGVGFGQASVKKPASGPWPVVIEY